MTRRTVTRSITSAQRTVDSHVEFLVLHEAGDTDFLFGPTAYLIPVSAPGPAAGGRQTDLPGDPM